MLPGTLTLRCRCGTVRRPGTAQATASRTDVTELLLEGTSVVSISKLSADCLPAPQRREAAKFREREERKIVGAAPGCVSSVPGRGKR